VRTTCFWNNLHQVPSNQNIVKPYHLKSVGAIKPKVLNRIAKIGKCYLCLRDENLSNYIDFYLIAQYSDDRLTWTSLGITRRRFRRRTNTSIAVVLWSRICTRSATGFSTATTWDTTWSPWRPWRQSSMNWKSKINCVCTFSIRVFIEFGGAEHIKPWNVYYTKDKRINIIVTLLYCNESLNIMYILECHINVK
jgi:hypothetical protein